MVPLRQNRLVALDVQLIWSEVPQLVLASAHESVHTIHVVTRFFQQPLHATVADDGVVADDDGALGVREDRLEGLLIQVGDEVVVEVEVDRTVQLQEG